MKFTTPIPTTLNDGTAVPGSTVRRLMADWSELFGGCTNEGIVEGHWIDPADGTHYHDECVKLTVVCDNELYDTARDAVLSVGRHLGQKAMYFEIRDFDGVRILTVD